jgi:hypothetical protein
MNVRRHTPSGASGIQGYGDENDAALRNLLLNPIGPRDHLPNNARRSNNLATSDQPLDQSNAEFV